MAAQLSFRPAQPTLEDGRAFARYLDTAAEGFFGLMLGPRAAEILATAFLDPGQDLSYENVTFVIREGRPVGMASGYTAAAHRGSTMGSLVRAAGPRNLRFLVVSTLVAPVFRVMDTIEDGDYYIQAVAVDHACRGEGLGSRLLDGIEERARAAGAARLALDVAASNLDAQRLYVRRGWSVLSRWPRFRPLQRFGFHRMTRTLD